MFIQFYMDIKRKYKATLRIVNIIAFLLILFFPVIKSSANHTNDSLIVVNILKSFEDHNLPNDSLEKLLDSALILSKKTGDEYLTAQVFKVKGDYYLDYQLYTKSLENYYKALKFYKNNPKKQKVYLNILINISMDYYYLNNTDSIFSITKQLFNRVIRGVDNKDYYLQAVYENIGSYYELKEDWASALQYYFLSYKTAKKLDDKRLEASELLNIGIIYDFSGDQNKAIQYYNKAREIGKKYNYKEIVSAASYNLNNHNDTTYNSLEIALRNLEDDKKTGSLYNITLSYNNVGVIYCNLDSLQKALKFYHTSLGFAKKYNFEQLILLIYYNLGELYADTSGILNLDSAKYYLKKGIILSEKLNRKDDKFDFLNILQQVYAYEGKYYKAYKTVLEMEKLHQKVHSKQNEKQLLEINARYETERKLKELAKAESDAKRWKLYSVIFSLALLLLFLILLSSFKIRKIKSKKLLDQQQFFNELIENTEDYFLIISTDLLKITYANPTFLEDFGGENKKTSINRLFDLLISEKNKVQFKNILKNIKEETLFSARFSVWVKNIKNEKKYITGIITNKKNDKILNGVLMNFWDITKQHKTEMLLKKNEKRYRDIYESFPDIYYKESKTGEILEISPSVEKILGYSPSEVLGKKAIIFYDKIEERRYLTTSILANGELKDGIITLIKKDGNKITCSLTASPFFDESGNYMGTVGVLRDITNRIQRQLILKETVETKNKLFEILANDLVNPVSQYKDLLDVLVNNIKNFSTEQIVSHVSVMKPIIDSTNCLLDNLLSWSRLMRNKVVPSIYAYNLYKIIKQNIEFFSYNAKKKNIKLVCTGDKSIEVLTDFYMLDIVLRNLISNAIKFSSENDTVTVSYKKENKKANIEISNQTTQIPDNILKAINKRTMDLVLISGSQYERGTGLGLVVVKRFLEILRSKINISKNSNGGVSFSFKLPLK